MGIVVVLPQRETAHQLEADVVVRLPVQQTGEREGVFHGKIVEALFAGQAVHLPQHPRIEPTGPPADVAGHERISLEGPGAERWPVGAGHDVHPTVMPGLTGHLRHQEAVHIHGLLFREGEDPVAQMDHRFFLGRARSAGYGRERGQQKQSSHTPKIRNKRKNPHITSQVSLLKTLLIKFFYVSLHPQNSGKETPEALGKNLIYLFTNIYAYYSTVGPQRTRAARSEEQVSCAGCLPSEAWRVPSCLHDDS